MKKREYVNSTTVASFSAGVLGGALGIASVKVVLGVLVAEAMLVAIDESDIAAPFSYYNTQSLGNRTLNLLATWFGAMAAEKAWKQPETA